MYFNTYANIFLMCYRHLQLQYTIRYKFTDYEYIYKYNINMTVNIVRAMRMKKMMKNDYKLEVRCLSAIYLYKSHVFNNMFRIYLSTSYW